MGAFITDRPEIKVSGQVSRWNAVTNPVIFKVERRDVDILGVTDDNGLIKVTPTGLFSQLPFGIDIGDRVYINSGPYDEVGTIVGGGTGFMILDIPFSATSTGGYANFISKRINYRIKTRILQVINNIYRIIVTTGQFRMDERGVAKIDISAWLRTLPKMINDFDYVARNEADPDLGGNYIFQISELYTDPSGDVVVPFTDPAFDNLNFFVNAARQIQTEHGGNMAQFVPFITDVEESKKALFLSGFEEPSRFVGFPFDLQFIYSDNIADRAIKKQERSFDINSVLKDSNSDLLTQGHHTNVNRLTLEEGYDSDATELDVWLVIDTDIINVEDEYAEEEVWDNDYDGGGHTDPPPDPVGEAVPKG